VSDELVRERRGNVLVARLDRPEARNALDAARIRGIGEAMNDADAGYLRREDAFNIVVVGAQSDILR
jgi:enoyl-CoA hydratase/carnithine racemase